MRPLARLELAQEVRRNSPAPVRQARRQAVAGEAVEPPDIRRYALGWGRLIVAPSRLAQLFEGALVADGIVGAAIFLPESRDDPVGRFQPGFGLETDPHHV